MFWLRIFSALSLSALLVACNNNPFVVEITDCPAVAFVKNANTVTKFADGSQRVQDVAYTVHLSDLSVDCRDEGEGVRTYISFQVNAEKGPQGQAEAVDISYFVTVLREGDQIIGKRIFDSRVNFGPLDQGRTFERISQIIPNDVFADQYAHEVLIGIQLSEQDAAYNVRR